MRLFVAIGLPNNISQDLGRLQGSIASARWVMVCDMHLTLSFIGDVADGDIHDLEAELASIDFPAFEITLSGLGTFERRKKIHTLWAGVANEPALIALHDRVDAAVARAGHSPEKRKYKPHVSIARFSRASDPAIGPYIEANNTLANMAFTAENFSLYRSHLGRNGARYEALSTYELAKMTY
jgi:2'-5' RNA ligase